MRKVNLNKLFSLHSLEVFLWVSGAFLLVFCSVTLLSTRVLHGKDIKEFEAELDLTKNLRIDTNKKVMRFSSTKPNQKDWSEKRKIAYEKSVLQSKKKPVALLSIPAIDLKVAVLNGTDDKTLDRGIGRVPGTAKPNKEGNMALAGHRDGFFRGLKNIKIGDVIEVSTISGIYEYQVEKTLIVKPTDVSVIQPTEDSMITLITCFPFYFIGDAPERYIVRAPLKSIRPYPKSETNQKSL